MGFGASGVGLYSFLGVGALYVKIEELTLGKNFASHLHKCSVYSRRWSYGRLS